MIDCVVPNFFGGRFMIDRTREKLFHVIAFFAKKTKHCHKLKLFKLLYFTDFEHFKQTGRTVTGLEYFAWPMGPVPKKLDQEIQGGSEDLYESINFTPQRYMDEDFKKDKAINISPKRKFDKNLFSKREKRIMEKMVMIYKNATAKDMTAASHERGKPWDRVYNREDKQGEKIPYVYALDGTPGSISIEEADEMEREHNEMKVMFG